MAIVRNAYYCCWLIFLFSPPASALLIDQGDITLDDGSGLEWLDITLTQGQSVNSLLNGFGGYIDSGFRYATSIEVTELFTNAGIPRIDGTAPPANWQPVIQLQNLLGYTRPVPGGISYTEGYHGLNETGPGEVLIGLLASRVTYSQGAYAIPIQRRTTWDVADFEVGSFLVRPTSFQNSSTVPEPSSLTMFILGFLGIFSKRFLQVCRSALDITQSKKST